MSNVKIQPGRKERDNLWKLLDMAVTEDLGESGDVTSSVLPANVMATGKFVARQPMVLCGGAMLETIAARYDGFLKTKTLAEEGQWVQKGDVLAEWRGPARSMMAAERVALNFMQKLSSVATITREYVREVKGTPAKIFDTRKTTPGWRDLEKYAVRAGGGRNHRQGLYDAILIKDNHLAILARAEGADPILSVGKELARVRPFLPEHSFVELEVDTLEQFQIGLTLQVDIIMLDNMEPERLRKAVNMRSEAGLARHIELEASGGITLENLREIAETGVDRISIGALTHSSGSVDIGLDIEIE